MTDFDNSEPRTNRKQFVGNKQKHKDNVSEEQKFVSKSKKAFKNKVKEIQVEEVWEDWENE